MMSRVFGHVPSAQGCGGYGATTDLFRGYRCQNGTHGLWLGRRNLALSRWRTHEPHASTTFSIKEVPEGRLTSGKVAWLGFIQRWT